MAARPAPRGGQGRCISRGRGRRPDALGGRCIFHRICSWSRGRSKGVFTIERSWASAAAPNGVAHGWPTETHPADEGSGGSGAAAPFVLVDGTFVEERVRVGGHAASAVTTTKGGRVGYRGARNAEACGGDGEPAAMSIGSLKVGGCARGVVAEEASKCLLGDGPSASMIHVVGGVVHVGVIGRHAGRIQNPGGGIFMNN